MPILRRDDPSEFVYEFFGPKDLCAYCEFPAETIDHTVPRSFLGKNRDIANRRKWIKVQSCQSCNSILGNKLHSTFSERKKFLLNKITKRERRFLSSEKFYDDELEDIGRGLIDYLEYFSIRSEIAKRRLAFLADPNWPKGVPNDLWGNIIVSDYLKTLKKAPSKPQAPMGGTETPPATL